MYPPPWPTGPAGGGKLCLPPGREPGWVTVSMTRDLRTDISQSRSQWKVPRPQAWVAQTHGDTRLSPTRQTSLAETRSRGPVISWGTQTSQCTGVLQPTLPESPQTQSWCRTHPLPKHSSRKTWVLTWVESVGQIEVALTCGEHRGHDHIRLLGLLLGSEPWMLHFQEHQNSYLDPPPSDLCPSQKPGRRLEVGRR